MLIQHTEREKERINFDVDLQRKEKNSSSKEERKTTTATTFLFKLRRGLSAKNSHVAEIIKQGGAGPVLMQQHRERESGSVRGQRSILVVVSLSSANEQKKRGKKEKNPTVKKC